MTTRTTVGAPLGASEVGFLFLLLIFLLLLLLYYYYSLSL